VGSLDGANFVQTYDWSTFFEETTIKNCTQRHYSTTYFLILKTSPGKSFVKEAANSGTEAIQL